MLPTTSRNMRRSRPSGTRNASSCRSSSRAIILGILGFVPGVLIALGLYWLIAGATGLPLAMTTPRALGVLVATIVMCMTSGAIATRRLARAESCGAVLMSGNPTGDPCRDRGLNHWFGEGEARKQVSMTSSFNCPRKADRAGRASGSGKTNLLTLIGCLRQVQDGR